MVAVDFIAIGLTKTGHRAGGIMEYLHTAAGKGFFFMCLFPITLIFFLIFFKNLELMLLPKQNKSLNLISLAKIC